VPTKNHQEDEIKNGKIVEKFKFLPFSACLTMLGSEGQILGDTVVSPSLLLTLASKGREGGGSRIALVVG